MRTGRGVSLLGAGVVAAGLLAGCGGGSQAGTGPAPATRTTASRSTEPATSDVPPFPHRVHRQTGKAHGPQRLVLTDVRTGRHDGFDRMVLQFAGAGTPGWSAGYVKRPVLDGSGERVRLDGDAYLDVYASGTTYRVKGHDHTPPRVDPGDAETIQDLYLGGTFEGDTQVLLGIDGGRTPFRVFALAHPARLVVDVAGHATD